MSQIDRVPGTPSPDHVVMYWEGSEKDQWPLPALLSRRKLPAPSFHLVAEQFSSSPYVSNGFHSAALALELRGIESQ